MRLSLLLLCSLAWGDSWNCIKITPNGTIGPPPTLTPATYNCPNGGSYTWTQNAVYQVQAWSTQTNGAVWTATVGNPPNQITGTGACQSSSNSHPQYTPMVQPGGTPPAGYTQAAEWYVSVLSYTVTETPGGSSVQSTVTPQGQQNNIPYVCQCTQSDCSNPGATTCTTTCGGHCDGIAAICGGKPPSCPLLIDTRASGFHLTDPEQGVWFGFFPNHTPERIAWTDPKYGNGWLALPDAQGQVTNGTQLFGNITPQPVSGTPNGFAALAVYDLPANGGNGNGAIDAGDEIYAKLRVWIDANQDGISQPGELHTLAELGIARIGLSYEWTPWIDTWGNEYRYEGILWDLEGAQRQALFDVFLTTGN